jgi:DNA-3-methyladenine glycosylase
MNRNFFARDTRVVAKDLLGMELVRRTGAKTIRAMITETEAYKGFVDRASHASRGKTLRNAPMFGPPGTIYIYLVHGLYYMLNIVTEREEYPAAVLIRGARLLDSGKILNGPGKLTRALKITKSLNNANISTNKQLYLGKRIIKPDKIINARRVGVDYAGEWSKKPWRFLIQ